MTKREQAVAKEWYDFTGWEFMPQHEGESFYDALMRNRKWLEDRTTEALTIGNDISTPEETP